MVWLLLQIVRFLRRAAVRAIIGGLSLSLSFSLSLSLLVISVVERSQLPPGQSLFLKLSQSDMEVQREGPQTSPCASVWQVPLRPAA